MDLSDKVMKAGRIFDEFGESENYEPINKPTAKLVAYDIDGVLTAGIKPSGNYVIISGRTFEEYDDFAKRAALLAPVYIRGTGLKGDRVHAGHFKAMMVKMLGVTEFHEDEDFQIEIIKAINPGCKCIKV